MSRIGKYELEREIGRGAMGVVYLAWDGRLQRRVAVKVPAIPAGLPAEEVRLFSERFVREAQAAAILCHPGIVTIYDADEDPERNVPYIAMEYVPGRTLEQYLHESSPLDVDRALSIVRSLANALHAAHEAGIVHRDLKPANILLGEGDQSVKIADFGVARVADSELTRSGDSVGSPPYMSPEQIRGEVVDRRSDLFSLAVLLYKSLCGMRPFDGPDPTALFYAITHEHPVPITKHIAGLPQALDRFFDKALAKDPEERFPTGIHFCQALEEAFAGAREDVAATRVDMMEDASTVLVHCPPASRSTNRWKTVLRRRNVLVAAALLTVVVMGWALVGGKDHAYLKLKGTSGVEAATLSLLVDGKEVYARQLSAPAEARGFIKKLVKSERETFEAWIEVPSGKHQVVAHVIPDGGGSGYRDTVVIDLEPGETQSLRLVARQSFGSGLSLKVE